MSLFSISKLMEKSIDGYATGVNGIEGEHWSYETKGIPA